GSCRRRRCGRARPSQCGRWASARARACACAVGPTAYSCSWRVEGRRRMDLYDLQTLEMAGPEPGFDPVMRDFLVNCAEELRARHERGGLLDYSSLGRDAPWLYRLTFRTRGLVRTDAGE